MAELQAAERKLIAAALSIDAGVVAKSAIAQRQYSDKQVIAREGEEGDEAYVVLDGAVQVCVRGPGGNQLTIARLERGDLVGEQACLETGNRRHASLVAAGKATLAVVPGETVRAALAGDPRAAELMVERGQRHALERLHKFSATGAEIAKMLESAGNLQIRTLAAGEFLFSEGDTADFAGVVLSGALEARKWTDGGDLRVLGASGPGTLVGEVGVLDGAPRAATVRAREPSVVLIIPADITREICSAAGVQALTSALRAGYALAGRGIAYSVVIPGDEEDTVATTIKTADNRHITVSRTLLSRIVSAKLDRDPETEIVSPDALYRIGVAGGIPVMVEGPQDWPDLPQLMDRMLSNQTLEAWRLAAFKSSGILLFSHEEQDADADASIACACTGLSVQSIRGHALAGATTLDSLEKACGAGGVCGGCRNRLSGLLGRENFTLCRVGVDPLGEHAVRAVLHPIDHDVPKIAAGQHVTIDGLIDGNWVSRSYTVVEHDEKGIELGVKIEPQGMFSRWLAARGDGALVRVSDAHGEPISEAAEPILFAVAGIGVTPAIAAVRAIAPSRPVSVCYLYRGQAEAAYLDELEAAQAAGAIGLTCWDTAKSGRPDLRGLLGEAKDKSGADEALVCGPVPFAEAATQVLKAAGARVRMEVFTHAASGEGPPMICPGAWRDAATPPVDPAWQRYTTEQPGTMVEEARSFLTQFFTESGAPGAFDARWKEVADEIGRTGTYRQTVEELTFAARLAWRNAARCIGRLYWSGLKVRDFRHFDHPDDIAGELIEHLKLAYNDGNLTPVMSVFDPGAPGEPAVRLWNPQLMRYAGYRKDGKTIGDPGQLELTAAIEKLGWTGGSGEFDMLPLVVQMRGQKARYYEIPAENRYEVAIRHPEHPGIEELGLRWYTVPAVSDMALDAGGIVYRCAPFNGWYMATEIGARNFTDVERYNLILEIAGKLGLDTSRETTLWRDKAITVMTEAVLWSFENSGVKITDHHNASMEFLQFCQNEQTERREVCGHWPWLVPPIGGSATPLFLDNWTDVEIKPTLMMQTPAYAQAAE